MTIRYAHLSKSPHKLGDTIKRGDIVGIMGNTGYSHGPHLHLDGIDEHMAKPWKQSDIDKGIYHPCPEQLSWFVDKELFNRDFVVTTWYCDYRYYIKEGKLHYGYDIIPAGSIDSLYPIYWNRSMDGVVIANGTDPGYGNYIHIWMEA